MATCELYRISTIGMCLTETLDQMVSNGVLSPELAIQVLLQFEKSMTEALENEVKSKVSIKVDKTPSKGRVSLMSYQYTCPCYSSKYISGCSSYKYKMPC